MNISIDDLVSSFSASHVSQEAMDIANLQSQLTKALYYPSQTQPGVHRVSRRNSYAQPCNTPTPTSATATLHWEWEDTTRYRGQNPTLYTAPAPLRSFDVDDEMEDEQAVEDLLNPHTSNLSQSGASLRHQPLKFRPIGHPFSSQPTPSVGTPTYDNTSGPSPSSHFTNTDPFYLAAVQTTSLTPSPSFFAQAARPAPNSPFNLNISAQQTHHPLEVESRALLVGIGQSR
ncbi:hypothetical protein B0F90DRAFT_1715992 [Multifurca ochricompacta]|uniref:Uncharacterized protein n=1 Tax=Multifurca ochricompacta TaxID=376703 RepID=A0AAD4QMS9_9AGAM|nr:hypothetical protein B0F90DRAFT_1715992 [Multifurca ochricompacta]